jgi:hypothetical protein
MNSKVNYLPFAGYGFYEYENPRRAAVAYASMGLLEAQPTEFPMLLFGAGSELPQTSSPGIVVVGKGLNGGYSEFVFQAVPGSVICVQAVKLLGSDAIVEIEATPGTTYTKVAITGEKSEFLILPFVPQGVLVSGVDVRSPPSCFQNIATPGCLSTDCFVVFLPKPIMPNGFINISDRFSVKQIC